MQNRRLDLSTVVISSLEGSLLFRIGVEIRSPICFSNILDAQCVIVEQKESVPVANFDVTIDDGHDDVPADLTRSLNHQQSFDVALRGDIELNDHQGLDV